MRSGAVSTSVPSRSKTMVGAGMIRGSVEHFQEKWNSGFPPENATSAKRSIFRKSGIPVFGPKMRPVPKRAFSFSGKAYPRLIALGGFKDHG